MQNGKYTIYARDEPCVVEDLQGGGNVYGSHPMHLQREKSNDFNVMFLKNSSGMDVYI